MSDPDVHDCAGCGASCRTKCASCGGAWYCGPKCQRADWPTHKSVCKKPVAAIIMTDLEAHVHLLGMYLMSKPDLATELINAGVVRRLLAIYSDVGRYGARAAIGASESLNVLSENVAASNSFASMDAARAAIRVLSGPDEVLIGPSLCLLNTLCISRGSSEMTELVDAGLLRYVVRCVRTPGRVAGAVMGVYASIAHFQALQPLLIEAGVVPILLAAAVAVSDTKTSHNAFCALDYLVCDKRFSTFVAPLMDYPAMIAVRSNRALNLLSLCTNAGRAECARITAAGGIAAFTRGLADADAAVSFESCGALGNISLCSDGAGTAAHAAGATRGLILLMRDPERAARAAWAAGIIGARDNGAAAELRAAGAIGTAAGLIRDSTREGVYGGCSLIHGVSAFPEVVPVAAALLPLIARALGEYDFLVAEVAMCALIFLAHHATLLPALLTDCLRAVVGYEASEMATDEGKRAAHRLFVAGALYAPWVAALRALPELRVRAKAAVQEGIVEAAWTLGLIGEASGS